MLHTLRELNKEIIESEECVKKCKCKRFSRNVTHFLINHLGTY